MRYEIGTYGPNGYTLNEMHALERIADELRKQSQSGIGGNHVLQADYTNAIRETLNAYNRLAATIPKEDDV